MNCPSRTDEPLEGDGHNQNPPSLSNDLTTNQDLNGIANSRELRDTDPPPIAGAGLSTDNDGAGLTSNPADAPGEDGARVRTAAATTAATPVGSAVLPVKGGVLPISVGAAAIMAAPDPSDDGGAGSLPVGNGRPKSRLERLRHIFFTFAKFIGPGFMIAVAYIDPGNYQTAISAGASYRFRLLFVVLLSNIFAIFLQSLSIKLGTVSGMNLAEACRSFLPRWLNYILYAFAEVAIIATDIAEVIGTAIALNLLIPQLPLVAGCAISILDVMVILFFYQPNGSMRGVRLFEMFVAVLVLVVVICFCIQLSTIQDTPVGHVFQGYLPSGYIIEQQGLYQACGILGATVMPHSLYLGSGVVQPRLYDYDSKRGLLPERPQRSDVASLNDSDWKDKVTYIPSLSAIRYCMKYSIAELSICLFSFALFVNSAILIVAGAFLYENPDALEADIFQIHSLLSSTISQGAGTIFAIALLMSGISAGIVCTISGQMVSEGALNWTIRPWLRRLITRLISITPSIIIAGAVGRSGLSEALNASQVALSIVLPFITAPLIYFTCRDKYMTVWPGTARYHVRDASDSDDEANSGIRQPGEPSKMANSWPVVILAVLIWLFIAILNVANLVLLGMEG